MERLKQVRMANNVNSKKLGEVCKEGLGRAVRPNKKIMTCLQNYIYTFRHLKRRLFFNKINHWITIN